MPFTPAISPTSSSTSCSAACSCICASKPAAFRVIDTHAGAGLYDLAAPKPARPANGATASTDCSTPTRHRVRALLAPYLDAVAAFNPPDRLAVYPGSPALARHFLRRQDRLIACELEPHAAAALARNLRGDARVKAIAIDGWTALVGLCSAEGAARRGAGRSAVRAAGRIRRGWRKVWKPRTANGRPAFTCSGIRSRSRRRFRPSPAASCARHRENPAGGV